MFDQVFMIWPKDRFSDSMLRNQYLFFQSNEWAIYFPFLYSPAVRTLHRSADQIPIERFWARGPERTPFYTWVWLSPRGEAHPQPAFTVAHLAAGGCFWAESLRRFLNRCPHCCIKHGLLHKRCGFFAEIWSISVRQGSSSLCGCCRNISIFRFFSI